MKKHFLITATFFSFLFLTLFTPANADTKTKLPELRIYTYDSFTSEWGPGPEIKQEFEKICNCKVSFFAFADGVSILNRLKLEGKTTKADIVLGLDNNLTYEAQMTNFLAPHKVDLSKLDLPIDWNSKYFVPYDYGYFAFVYNKQRLANPPKSLKDLIKRRDVKVIYEDPRSSTPGLGLLLWIEKVFGKHSDKAWEELAKHTVTVTKGWSEAYSLFLKGEADMVMSYTTSPAYHMINEKDFNYVAADFEEGHYMQVEVAAKVKNSKNQALADKFLDFMLSQKFQEKILINTMYPVTRVKLPDEYLQLTLPKKTLLYTDKEVDKNRKEWIKDWLNAIAK